MIDFIYQLFEVGYDQPWDGIAVDDFPLEKEGVLTLLQSRAV